MSALPEALQFTSPVPLVDIGANLTHESFHKDISEVLSRSASAGVNTLVITGTDQESIDAALKLLEQFSEEDEPPALYATAGIHPHHASDWNSGLAHFIEDALSHARVVAIGECGLDFNRNYTPQEVQQKIFEAHLELAAKHQRPLFLHERDASPRMLEMLRTWRDDIDQAVIHCFTGDRRTLYRYLDLDLHIGVTGWLCDERRGQDLREAARDIPLNRLMIETDCPYLLPRNLPAKAPGRRHEPAYLPWICRELANIQGISENEMAEATTQTAEKFFNLNP